MGGGSMPLFLVVVVRSVISFFSLLILIRIIGKQQIAQLTFFDYAVGITIGSIASTMSVQINENTFTTMVGMATWALLAIILEFFSLKSKKCAQIIEGKEEIIIENGKVLEEHLKRSRITIEEVLSELRSQGIFNIQDVEVAIYEPTGKLSVQKKAYKNPVTIKDLNLVPEYEGLPKNLIMDGKIQQDQLKKLNLTKAWLLHQLNKNGIDDEKQVFLAQLDSSMNLYVDLAGEGPSFVIDTKNEGGKA